MLNAYELHNGDISISDAVLVRCQPDFGFCFGFGENVIGSLVPLPQ